MFIKIIKSKYLVFFYILFAAAAYTQAFAAELVDRKLQNKLHCTEFSVCFDKELQVGTQKLNLLSTAKFTYMFFDVYTIALYGEKAGDYSNPKALVFHYHLDIGSQDMIKGANDNFDANPKIIRTVYEEELGQINKYYQDVSEGDRYVLLYNPVEGLSLMSEGKKLVTVSNGQFAKDYLGIWLSDYPLSRSLRDQLISN